MLKDTFKDPKELFEHLFRGNRETIDELILGLNIFVSNKKIFDYIDSMINEEFISNYTVVKTLFQSILINNPYILTSIPNLMDTTTGKILQDSKLTLEYEQYKLIKARLLLYSQIYTTPNIITPLSTDSDKHSFSLFKYDRFQKTSSFSNNIFRLPKKNDELVKLINNIIICLFQTIPFEDYIEIVKDPKTVNLLSNYTSFVNNIIDMFTENIMMKIYFSETNSNIIPTSDDEYAKLILYIISCFNNSIEYKNLATATIFNAVLSKGPLKRLKNLFEIVETKNPEIYKTYSESTQLIFPPFVSMKQFVDKNRSSLSQFGVYLTDIVMILEKFPLKKNNLYNYNTLIQISKLHKTIRTIQINTFNSLDFIKSEERQFFNYIQNYKELCISSLFQQKSLELSPRKE
jgi:hypothetical protein